MKILLSVLVLLSATTFAYPTNDDACIAAQGFTNGIRSNTNNPPRDAQASLDSLRDIVSQPLIDIVGFAAAKRRLLDLVSDGITSRSINPVVLLDDEKRDDTTVSLASCPWDFRQSAAAAEY